MARTLRLLTHGRQTRSPFQGFKDIVAMPLTRQPISAPAKLTRPARPHCRGGASSLLRLAQPAAPRLPAPLDLTDWLSRAAGAFGRSTALAGS